VSKAILKDWAVVVAPRDGYTAPELLSMRLTGTVFGHPHKSNGKVITTSAIQAVRGRIVHTQNTVYRLGQPHKDYVKYLHAGGFLAPKGRRPITLRSIK